MIRFYIILIIFINYTSLAISQDLDEAKNIIQHLSSKQFHGRGYLFHGDSIASHYIKNYFQKLKLQPLFNNSYFQQFNINVNTFPQIPIVKLDTSTLTLFKDYSFSPLTSTTCGKYKLKKLRNLKKYKNSTAIILSPTKITKQYKKTLHQYIYDDIIPYSLKKQTKIIAVTADSNVSSFSVSSKNFNLCLLNINPYKLKKAKNIEINIINQYIYNYSTRNVAALINGTTCPDTFIIITAHYDHLGTIADSLFFPGANDNASGVSMILQLAKYFQTNKPKYSIIILATAAEELGLLGAKHFVKALTNNEIPNLTTSKIKTVINLDMIGTGDDGATVVNGDTYKDDFNKMKNINDNNNYLKNLYSRELTKNSDHYPFHEAGIKAFFFYTMGGTTKYHSTNDLPEKLSLKGYIGMFSLIIDYINTL